MPNDVARGFTVSPPSRDKLTMRAKLLKTHDLMVRRLKAVSNHEPVEASLRVV
jgi:hypothetical protein